MTRAKSNAFDLTHDVKMSADMGILYPVMFEEALPGDVWKIGAEVMIRFAPLIAPVMHRFDVSIHYFKVPNRILWAGWEPWITGDDTRVPPTLTVDYNFYGPLCDRMQCPRPANAGGNYQVNALPFAAYQLIWNEYYRDQNLQTSIAPNLALQDGNNSQSELVQLRRRCWEHDYFTASLPFAQKGSAVDIPLGDVVLKDNWDDDSDPRFRSEFDNQPDAGDVNSNTAAPFITVPDGDAFKQAYDPDGSLETSPTTINTLRRAYSLQRWLEKNARAGTRYVENLLVNWGLKPQDARLQRPEYITGVKSPVMISEVLNTTGEDAGLPQGNMAGHGVGYISGKTGSYHCKEHGWIIGVMSIMPKTAYQQGVPRSLLKTSDRFEYFWHDFAHIGEQEVKKREIYAQSSDPNGTFGYVPRYAEYRFANSRVNGDFQTSLNYWHLGRIFETEPELNSTFVECNPSKRIFAVTEEGTDSLYCHVMNHVTAIRQIPKFGTPY